MTKVTHSRPLPFHRYPGGCCAGTCSGIVWGWGCPAFRARVKTNLTRCQLLNGSREYYLAALCDYEWTWFLNPFLRAGCLRHLKHALCWSFILFWAVGGDTSYRCRNSELNVTSLFLWRLLREEEAGFHLPHQTLPLSSLPLLHVFTFFPPPLKPTGLTTVCCCRFVATMLPDQSGRTGLK